MDLMCVKTTLSVLIKKQFKKKYSFSYISNCNRYFQQEHNPQKNKKKNKKVSRSQILWDPQTSISDSRQKQFSLEASLIVNFFVFLTFI